MEIDITAELENIGIVHANPVHAGLDCEVVLANRTRSHSALTIGERKLDGIDGRHDVLLDKLRNRGYGRLAQYENRSLDSSLAQLDALANRGDREHVRASRVEHARAFDGSVPVSICLDNAAQLLPRSEQAFVGTQVPTECSAIYLNPRPTPLGHLHLRHRALRLLYLRVLIEHAQIVEGTFRSKLHSVPDQVDEVRRDHALLAKS